MKDYIVMAIGVIAAFGIVYILLFSNTVQTTIDSKHFSCVEAEPFGLEARCVTYSRNKGAR